MATRNYATTYDALHRDSRLLAICEMAILINLVPAVQAEDPGTADHAARLAWATAVEQDDGALQRSARRLQVKCAQNATIRAAIGAGAQPEESDVEFVAGQYLATLVTLEG